jgi:hypothetical protein
MTVVRVVLGVILLSDISFRATYRNVHQFPVMQSGLSPINTTWAHASGFNRTATSDFWWLYPSILADGKTSRSVTPISCVGEFCAGFFIPGPLSIVLFNSTTPNIMTGDYPSATSYIQQDAPGYQIDYSPIDIDQSSAWDDCRVYGISDLAIQLCLKNSNSSLLAGTIFLLNVNAKLGTLAHPPTRKSGHASFQMTGTQRLAI